MAEHRQNHISQGRQAANETSRQRSSEENYPPSSPNRPKPLGGRLSPSRTQSSSAQGAASSQPLEQGNAHYGYQGKTGKPRGKKLSGPWRIVFWVALVLFVVSLVALGTIVYSYLQGQNTYKGIEEAADFTPPVEAAGVDGSSLADMKVDWDALKAINPDTVGWIYIPGTPVNYPLVHTTNNDKYLTTDFTGTEGWLANFGTIFLAAENTPNFSDANNILYGHHMNDGSMFACIDDFVSSDEFNAHRTIYILTPRGNYRLTTFSLVICDANDPLAQPYFSSKEAFTSYLQDKVDRSVVTLDSDLPVISDISKIFALVTCDYTRSNGRAVLFASVVESTVVENDVNKLDGEDEDSSGGTTDGQNAIAPEDIAKVEDAAKEIE